MRGFQIWPQNSNRITLDSFFAKKLSKVGKIPDLAYFSFFCRIGVKCYPIWILRTDSESSHHFAYFRPPFDTIFAFLLFDPMHFQKFLIKFTTPISAWNQLLRAPSHSACSKTWEASSHSTCFQFPKLMFFCTNIMTTGPQLDCSSHSEILHERFLHMRYV